MKGLDGGHMATNAKWHSWDSNSWCQKPMLSTASPGCLNVRRRASVKQSKGLFRKQTPWPPPNPHTYQ